MKQLLFLILCTASLCSCHVLKKANKSNKTNTEILTNTTSTDVEVKKKDSTGTNTTKTTESKKIDSGYTKTTTIVREWFSDEFGDEEDTAKRERLVYVDPQLYSGGGMWVNEYATGIEGKLKKRETISIQETGFKNASNDFAMMNENAGKISGLDSSNKTAAINTQAKTAQETKENSKFNLSVVPWYVFVFLIVAIIGAIYLKVKFF